jgi:hypothetical protein
MQLHNSVVVGSHYYMNSYSCLRIHTCISSCISFSHLSFLHISHSHINTSLFSNISLLVSLFYYYFGDTRHSLAIEREQNPFISAYDHTEVLSLSPRHVLPCLKTSRVIFNTLVTCATTDRGVLTWQL